MYNLRISREVDIFCEDYLRLLEHENWNQQFTVYPVLDLKGCSTFEAALFEILWTNEHSFNRFQKWMFTKWTLHRPNQVLSISIWNLQLQPYQWRPSKGTQYLWLHPIKRANTSTCLPEKTCATTAQKPRNTKISIYRQLQRRAQSSNQDERMNEHISQGVLTGFSAVVSSYPLTCSVRTFSSKSIQNTWHRNLGHINPRATV